MPVFCALQMQLDGLCSQVTVGNRACTRTRFMFGHREEPANYFQVMQPPCARLAVSCDTTALSCFWLSFLSSPSKTYWIPSWIKRPWLHYISTDKVGLVLALVAQMPSPLPAPLICQCVLNGRHITILPFLSSLHRRRWLLLPFFLLIVPPRLTFRGELCVIYVCTRRVNIIRWYPRSRVSWQDRFGHRLHLRPNLSLGDALSITLAAAIKRGCWLIISLCTL